MVSFGSFYGTAASIKYYYCCVLILPFIQLQTKYNNIIRHSAQNNAKKKYTDQLPIIPQSSTSSLFENNLNSCELPEQHEVKRKKFKKRKAAIEQSETDLLKSKRPITRSMLTKIGDFYDLYFILKTLLF